MQALVLRDVPILIPYLAVSCVALFAQALQYKRITTGYVPGALNKPYANAVGRLSSIVSSPSSRA